MATINKNFTFSAGSTIIASEHNANFDTVYDDYNGNVTNANISGSAAIANAKLNLASIAQTITFAGNTTFAGTTIADLGTVTTADIDGGTLDGVQVGGTTATGELLVNDSSDGANGLGSQGTSAQVLTSAGVGANPTWETVADGANTSNVIFCWSGHDTFGASDFGFLTGTSNAPDISGVTTSLIACGSSTLRTILRFQFTKISGISTITIHSRIWSGSVSASHEAIMSVDIGGQSNTVKSTTSSTPTWVTTATIDVSSLSGTNDGIIQLRNENSNQVSYCSGVILIAS